MKTEPNQKRRTFRQEGRMKIKWTAKVTTLAAAIAVWGAPSIAHPLFRGAHSERSSRVRVGAPPAMAAKLASIIGTPPCGGALPCAVWDVFKDGVVSIADLTALSAQATGAKTLFDPCDGPGTPVTCVGPADADTGLPTHDVG